MLHQDKFDSFKSEYEKSCTTSDKKIRFWYFFRSNSLSNESIERFDKILTLIATEDEKYLEKKYDTKWQYHLLQDCIDQDILNPRTDKGSLEKGSALVRGYIVPLETLGLLFIDNQKSVSLTEVGKYLINTSGSATEIITKQVNKLQFPDPFSKSHDQEWFKKGIIPGLFLIDVLSQIENKKITENEFLLFVNLGNSMDDVDKVVDWIKCWRDLTNNERKKTLNEIKKIKKGNNVRWDRMQRSFTYTVSVLCFPEYLEYDSSKKEIKLNIKALSAEELLKSTQVKVTTFNRDQSYEWSQYLGNLKSKPDWLNNILIELKRAQSLVSIKKTEKYKTAIKGLTKEENLQRVRKEKEKHIEDYYIKHLTEIEDGLEPYTGHNPNPKERHPSRQYPSATGPIDILCKAKNGDIVVLEIKAHEAKDSVFGQILRYIGHLKRSPLGKGKNIRGIILASDFPDKARYSRIGLPVDNPKDFIKFRKHNFAPLEDI